MVTVVLDVGLTDGAEVVVMTVEKTASLAGVPQRGDTVEVKQGLDLSVVESVTWRLPADPEEVAARVHLAPEPGARRDDKFSVYDGWDVSG